MKIKIYKTREEKNIKYMEIVKNILVNNSHKSIILLVKNSYYYISIIVLYAILSTRYSYNIETIENDLTFIYLFGIYIINLIIDVSSLLIKNGNRDKSAITYICIMFRYAMTIAIVLGITSPLLCKILFDSNNNSIYLTMLSFLIVFIILYNTTFDYIKNKKLIYISLIVGIISKLILVIPLINSIYRMGYNLVYGDIISTIIGIFITIIINYVYIKLKNKKEKTLESILLTLYESVLLCIVLVILQFIVPIRTDSYIRAIFTFLLYITISVMIVKLKKKRG